MSTTSASIGWCLLFTVSVSVLSGALFGALAVLRFGKPSLTALKEGGRSASDAPGRHRTRDALVVGQIALALTLLIVSGLMIRTFIAMRQVDPGFTRPEEVQTFVLAIPASLIGDPQQAAAHVRGRCRTTGARARRHLRWSLVFHHDGRRRQRQLRRDRGIPRPGRGDGQAPAVQERRARILRDDGQPAGRRALDHLERHPRAAARRHHFRAARARVLGRAGEGDRQARARQFPESSVARDRRRVRQRARRWTDAAADGDRLLADAERELSVAHDGLRGAVDARRRTRLSSRARASGLVGQSESAARDRADARGDPGELDGADIVSRW